MKLVCDCAVYIGKPPISCFFGTAELPLIRTLLANGTLFMKLIKLLLALMSVSYTHLDVYKRQVEIDCNDHESSI